MAVGGPVLSPWGLVRGCVIRCRFRPASAVLEQRGHCFRRSVQLRPHYRPRRLICRLFECGSKMLALNSARDRVTPACPPPSGASGTARYPVAGLSSGQMSSRTAAIGRRASRLRGAPE